MFERGMGYCRRFNSSKPLTGEESMGPGRRRTWGNYGRNCFMGAGFGLGIKEEPKNRKELLESRKDFLERRLEEINNMISELD